MSTLTAVINQIKESSDSIEESESIYLNEIFDAINDSFKSLGATLEIGFALVSDSMTGSMQKLETEESIQDAKIFEDINESIKELKDVISKQKLKTETDIKSVPSETVSSNKAIVMASKDTTAAIKETTESLKETASNTSSETVITPNSIEELKVALSDQKIKVDIDNITSDISVSLKELNNGEQLSEEFERLRSTLDTSSAESREIALNQLEAFSNLTIDAGKSEKSQEDIRESNTVTGKMAAAMTNLNDGVSKLGEGLGQIAGGAAKGIGIAGLIMLFVAPEKAMEILDEVMKVFTQGITAITDLFSGSTEGLEDFVKDNPLVSAVLAIAGVIAAIMGVISVIGSITAGIATVGTSLGVIGGVFATIGGVLGALGAGPVLAIAAVVAAIGIAIYSLVEAFSDAFDVFSDTGSIFEGLKEFFSSFIGNFIGIILDIPKGLISWIADALGFDNFSKMLDSFSFVDIIKEKIGLVIDLFKSVFDVISVPFEVFGALIGDLFNGFGEIFSGIFDIIKGIFTFDLGLIFGGLSSIFGGIIDIILSPFTAIKDLVVGLVETIGNAIKSFIAAIIPDWAKSFIPDSILESIGVSTGDDADMTQEDKDIARKEEAIKARKAEAEDPDTNPLVAAELNEEITELNEEIAALKVTKTEKASEQATSDFFNDGGLFTDASIDRSAITDVSTGELKSILKSSDTLNAEDYKFIQEEVAKREALGVKVVDGEVTLEPQAYSFPEQKDQEASNFKGFDLETSSTSSIVENAIMKEQALQESALVTKAQDAPPEARLNDGRVEVDEAKRGYAPLEKINSMLPDPLGLKEMFGDDSSSIMSMMPDPLGISEMLFGDDSSSIMSMMPDPLGLKEMFGDDSSSIMSMMPDPLGLKEMFGGDTSSIMSMMPDPLGLKEMFGGDMVSPNLESDKPVSALRDAQIANNQLSDMDKQSGTDAVVSAINTSAVNNTSSNNTTIVNNNNRGIDDLIRSMAYSPAY